jgi:hypothetical protein
MAELIGISEALIEVNQPCDGTPLFQGFGGDTSNPLIAAAPA